MTLRALFLRTVSRNADPSAVESGWRRVQSHGAMFGRILTAEECARELLTALGTHGTLPAVATNVRSQLRTRATLSAVHMLRLKARLGEIVQALRENGVPTLLLKGAAFCATGLRPLRTCKDIDLLVDASDIGAASLVLERLGFTRNPAALWPEAHQLPPFLDQDGLTVELHTRALARQSDSAVGSWCTRELQTGVSVLAPTDWCWHTLAHDAFHHVGAGSVRTALDVAALIDHFPGEIDWEIVVARARTWPDRIEPAIWSLAQLGYVTPVAVSRRLRLAVGCATAGREVAARVAARDPLFVFAAGKIGGLTLGSPRTWTDIRKGPLREDHRGPLSCMVRDAGRLTEIMLGRDIEIA